MRSLNCTRLPTLPSNCSFSFFSADESCLAYRHPLTRFLAPRPAPPVAIRHQHRCPLRIWPLPTAPSRPPPFRIASSPSPPPPFPPPSALPSSDAAPDRAWRGPNPESRARHLTRDTRPRRRGLPRHSYPVAAGAEFRLRAGYSCTGDAPCSLVPWLARHSLPPNHVQPLGRHSAQGGPCRGAAASPCTPSPDRAHPLLPLPRSSSRSSRRGSPRKRHSRRCRPRSRSARARSAS